MVMPACAGCGNHISEKSVYDACVRCGLYFRGELAGTRPLGHGGRRSRRAMPLFLKRLLLTAFLGTLACVAAHAIQGVITERYLESDRCRSYAIGVPVPFLVIQAERDASQPRLEYSGVSPSSDDPAVRAWREQVPCRITRDTLGRTEGLVILLADVLFFWAAAFTLLMITGRRGTDALGEIGGALASAVAVTIPGVLMGAALFMTGLFSGAVPLWLAGMAVFLCLGIYWLVCIIRGITGAVRILREKEQDPDRAG